MKFLWSEKLDYLFFHFLYFDLHQPFLLFSFSKLIPCPLFGFPTYYMTTSLFFSFSLVFLLFATKIPFWLLCICCLSPPFFFFFFTINNPLTNENCKWAYRWAPYNVVWWPFSHPLQQLTLLTHLPCFEICTSGLLSPWTLFSTSINIFSSFPLLSE